MTEYLSYNVLRLSLTRVLLHSDIKDFVIDKSVTLFSIKNKSNSFNFILNPTNPKPIASFIRRKLLICGANTLLNLYSFIKDPSLLIIKFLFDRRNIKRTFHQTFKIYA